MLLDNGNLNVQELMAGSASGKKIAKIVVGTSDTPVTSADTTITGAVEKTVATVNYLGGGIVSFTATLEAGDPAMTIKEIGLLDEDNILVHRKVISPTVKSSGISYTLTYNIRVQ